MHVGISIATEGRCQSPTPTRSATPVSSATETPSPTTTFTSTPVILNFNPDLDDNGVVNAEDLLQYIRAWHLVSFVLPTPTPPFTTLTGVVRSTSTELGLQNAWIIAGTAAQLSQAFGFYQIPLVQTDTQTVLVNKDGYQMAEFLFEPDFPVTLFNPVLYPLGFPTFTPSPTPEVSSTPTPSRSPTPDPSWTATPSPTRTTAQATSTRTATPTPTFTNTRTPSLTRTPTNTPTPTVVPLLGFWQGKLNPNGGTVITNTDITWTVTGANQATAEVLEIIFTGAYTFTPPGSVHFNVINGQDAIQLDMTWNGANGLSGTFDLSVFSRQPFGRDTGDAVLSRNP